MLKRRQFLATLGLGISSVALGSEVRARSGTAPRIDNDGMMRMSDQRRFVLGLYQLPKRSDALAQGAAAGFNLVHRPAETTAYDEAWNLGLHGWSSLGSLAEGAERPTSQQKIRKLVESLRHHPGLLFWETEDEPTFVWQKPEILRVPARRIVETADWIRRWDPGRPLYLNHSPTHLVETLQSYNAAADILATDIYPVIPGGLTNMYALWADGRQGDLADNTLAQVGRYADKMRKVAGSGRCVLMVLQAFAWEDLRDKGRDPDKALYPTLAQLRFMAWQSIIHEVNGILWWGMAYLPEGSSLWTDLLQVGRELASVQPELCGRVLHRGVKLHYHETGHSLDRGVEWTLRRSGHHTLLAMVNADPNLVEVSVSGLPARARLRPLWSTSVGPSVSSGRFRERFQPYEARVWLFPS